jgi:cell division protein FtsN
LENEPAEAIETAPPNAEQNKYFLIAGSFSHLKNASDLQDQLKAKGINAEVMITENRMYRVSVGSFATIGEAETELARVKSRPGLESCWILSN